MATSLASKILKVSVSVRCSIRGFLTPKCAVHEFMDPEFPDRALGYAVQHEPGYWLIFCRHPLDILPHLKSLIPGIDESQIPTNVHDRSIKEYSDEGDGLGIPEQCVNFVWHGHGGLSAISWFMYLKQVIKRSDFRKITDFCFEVFA